MELWRLISRHRLDDALTGEGIARIGGRWNGPGTRVLYCSSSREGAAAELTALAGAIMPSGFVFLPIHAPDTVSIDRISRESLPRDWKSYPAPETLRSIGDEWARSQRSCLLEVPSVVSQATNFLVNPDHPEFRAFLARTPMPFDPGEFPNLPSQVDRFLFQGAAHKEMVFFCHAREDKKHIVDPLAKAFSEQGISYWLDTAEIKWGDSIVEKVNDGLRRSRYVVVVLSRTFVRKQWPNRELNAVLNLEAKSGQVQILPILSGTDDDVRAILEKYPLLNDKLFLRWKSGPAPIVEALLDRLASP